MSSLPEQKSEQDPGQQSVQKAPKEIEQKLESKSSSFLIEKSEITMSKLGTDQLKSSFAHALKKSITLDIKNVGEPKPHSVFEIEERYGFNGHIQKSYFIAINRQSAKEFLKELGFPITTAFDKTYNKPAYVEMFKREPFIIGKRSIILTYAEWLHFVKFTYEPVFPPQLKDYIK